MNQEKLKSLREKYREPQFQKVNESTNHSSNPEIFTQYSGLSTLLGAPYQGTLHNLDVALIGIPFDLGVIRRAGARFGPMAIREERSIIGPMNHETKVDPFKLCKIADIGDIDLAMFSLEQGIEQIEAYYDDVIDKGVAPVSAGGDHSVTYPILKALGRQQPVSLVHIDAHCDTMGSLDGNKFHHGGPFRFAVLDGVLDPERTIQIGIRGAAEPYWEFSYESGMTVIHIEDVEQMGIQAVIDKAKKVVGDGPTYVSFDIDGLDPSFAPGTCAPEIGGLTTREAIQILRGLRGLNIVGGDLVEVAPEYDPTSCTAQVGKQMMFEILCLVAETVHAK